MERKMVLKIPEKGVSDHFILKIAQKEGKSQVQKMLNKASAFERLDLSFPIITRGMNSNLKTGCSLTRHLCRQLVWGAVLSEGLTESARRVKDHTGQTAPNRPPGNSSASCRTDGLASQHSRHAPPEPAHRRPSPAPPAPSGIPQGKVSVPLSYV